MKSRDGFKRENAQKKDDGARNTEIGNNKKKRGTSHLGNGKSSGPQ